jgi:sulfoxide reductase catalytic subunit YedY
MGAITARSARVLIEATTVLLLACRSAGRASGWGGDLMFIHRRNPLDPVGGQETPEKVYFSRRKWLAAAGLGAGGAALAYYGWQWWRGSDESVLAGGRPDGASALPGERFYPAPRDGQFTYGRTETDEAEAARYTNFYEFSSFKWSWRLVGPFRIDPWTVTIDGLCRNPSRLSIDELLKTFITSFSERQYRHRCVERWAMAVPWSGIPLAALIKAADPLAVATHVRFVSFNRPSEAPGISGQPDFPWPYTEGLTLAEAANELAFIATGMYGHPLLKQHGAPVRLVVPWKYGYKSIKSIERIEFVDREPATFWSTIAPEAYPFESNVDPDVARPWPQREEHMLGTGETFPTQKYNGYAQYVAELYPA